MRKVDLYFILLATTSLLVGVMLGIWMGIVHDFQFAPAHAHMNLVGWASLALFGLCYRVYPQLADSRIALFHFVTACIGAVIFPLGIALSIAGITVAVAIAGSFIWFAAVILFFVNVARIMLAPSRSRILMPAE